MAKRSLAEEIEMSLRGYPSVTRVRRVKVSPAKGRRKVKIVANGDHVVFVVSEPDHPRIQIRAESSNVSSVVCNMTEQLNRNSIPVE